MAQLPTVKGIRREDLGQDLPEWIENLLTPLSNFMESVYNAFNKNITFKENIACNLFTIEFTTSSTYTTGTFEKLYFNTTLKGSLNGCIVINCQNLTDQYALNTLGISPSFSDLSPRISINYISGLANSTKYKVTLLVI